MYELAFACYNARAGSFVHSSNELSVYRLRGNHLRIDQKALV